MPIWEAIPEREVWLTAINVYEPESDCQYGETILELFSIAKAFPAKRARKANIATIFGTRVISLVFIILLSYIYASK
jgi:hypothetical protein